MKMRSELPWDVEAFSRIALLPRICNICVWTNPFTPPSSPDEIFAFGARHRLNTAP